MYVMVLCEDFLASASAHAGRTRSRAATARRLTQGAQGQTWLTHFLNQFLASSRIE